MPHSLLYALHALGQLMNLSRLPKFQTWFLFMIL